MCPLIKSQSDLQVLLSEASNLPLLPKVIPELPSLPNGTCKAAHLMRVAWALLSLTMAFSVLFLSTRCPHVSHYLPHMNNRSSELYLLINHQSNLQLPLLAASDVH